ncbi:phenylalanine--tRNA ligase subunit beta [Salinicoccus hispanicus]|uniref:Phenylalanine--tRNA ligase beta subunit n=1 Tax=Salinicoccus hispanicus TaxID=157225 RepID=A0A6N8U445_9STAP|nr:phenylalanine--tRNA ligase subunit beta [Salinicoccus hispanicus]MXQ50419.1 phenylalanine--tRNA ligase subunit beta [Salinicoccus hispanicus]
MKVSREWLNEWIPNEVPVNALAEKITRGGIEVDEIIDYTSGVKNLVVGYVKTVTQHPEADRLRICQVDTGEETHQIICGAPNVKADSYVVVCKVGGRLPGGIKIKRAKLRGEVSEGMICSLEELGIKEDQVPAEYQNGIFMFQEERTPGEDALAALLLDDQVMEFDLTPNRKDALSMAGAAYETRALFGGEVEVPAHEVADGSETAGLEIRNEDDEAVPFYGARIVQGVTIAPSPTWMQMRLIKAGVRPINNVVDISNYALLEFGQPLHMFDRDQIGSDEIVTRYARDDEKMTTLDGKERTLESGDIVITNGSEPIALAGVMGGEFSEVTDQTTTVVIESAVFDPVSIRKTSGRLNLRSEASSRFEKGVSHEFVLKALDRAALLLEQYAGGTVASSLISAGELDVRDTEISITRAFINDHLGMELSTEEIQDTLSKLGLDTKVENDALLVSIPSRRDDLKIKQDITEEVARIYGYDALPSSMPRAGTTSGKLTDEQKKTRIVRHQLESLGLSQTINYALTSRGKADQFNELEGTVELLMPMSEDHAVLRKSMIPHLVDNVVYNRNRQQKDVQFYEIGRIFKSNGTGALPEEREMLAGIITGEMNRTDWLGTKVPADFFAAKGIVESVLEKLGLRDSVRYEQSSRFDALHPGRSADVLLDNERIGFIGELHPKYAQQNDLDRTAVFEVDLARLLSVKQGNIIYDQLSRYPSITRDIALVVEETVAADTLVRTVETAATKHLVDVFVFDVYEGDNMEAGKKSVGLRLTYLNKEDTLTDEEIEKQHTPVLEALESNGAQIR